jgi:hypothetical protein
MSKKAEPEIGEIVEIDGCKYKVVERNHAKSGCSNCDLISERCHKVACSTRERRGKTAVWFEKLSWNDKSRKEALGELLSPITWSLSSSICCRQQHVTDRRKTVLAIYPFLTIEEKFLANKWLREEKHRELWE